MQGSDTQELQKCAPRPVALDDARGEEAEFRVVPVTNAKTVSSVVEKFREKYGAKDVKKHYSKFDVAAVAQLT